MLNAIELHADGYAGAPPAPHSARGEVMAALVDQRAKLIAAIMSVTGLDRPDAEDVVQEITYRVLDRDVVLDDPTKWFPYLKAAAINHVRDDIKKAVRDERRMPSDVSWLAAEPLPDPAEAYGRRMVLLDVLADLNTLPPVERDVFWMRHYEGMKSVDIAALLGLRPRQVETKLRQAKQRLEHLHDRRRDTEAYVLLAALVRRLQGARAEVASATGPVLHSVGAAVAAFAVVVTFGSAPGAPRPALDSDRPVRPVAAPAFLTSAPTAGPGSTEQGAALVGGAAPARRTRLGKVVHRVMVHLPSPPHVCPAALCRHGDTLTVVPLGDYAPPIGTPSNVGTCDYVPANPVVACSRQEDGG